ncbi:hypothetical protein [Roseibium algae]|uniref:Uncharacterized protein n=1 Tax=Roseibium algae TaxID=3123038 RepID=A0ABU8TRY5_9HYPH
MRHVKNPHNNEHRHDHGHQHAHDHSHGKNHLHGHNHPGPDHLHSHVHGTSPKERTDELQTLAASFIDGFRAAEDKTSYLRLASIPFQLEGEDGLTQHLVDAKIVSHWQIGTASPAFASRELAYMPFPGSMVQSRETMTFTYVSLTNRDDIDLLTLLNKRLETETPQ